MNGDFPPRAGSTANLTPGKTVGRKLKLARAELAATEDFVAAALGLSVEDYRSVENGSAQLSPGRVIQAAQLFGLQPSALCIDTEPAAAPERAASATSATVIDFAAARLRRQAASS
jgi:transcriptional regulator with XRE-family HTH domain